MKKKMKERKYTTFTNQLGICSYLQSNGSLYLQCNTYEAQSFTSLMPDGRSPSRQKQRFFTHQVCTSMEYFFKGLRQDIGMLDSAKMGSQNNVIFQPTAQFRLQNSLHQKVKKNLDVDLPSMKQKNWVHDILQELTYPFAPQHVK